MAKTCYYYSAAAVAFLFLHCASAQIAFVVGDALRWAVPHDPDFYTTTWAAPKTFRLNDKLVFDFDKGEHDVVRVPNKVYDSCSFANQVLDTIKMSPYNHTLNETGANYFVCTNGRHCKMGLKLAVNVVSDSSTTPSNAPSPSSSSNPQPPPPPGSAAPPALAAGSFLIITLSFVLGKLVL